MVNTSELSSAESEMTVSTYVRESGFSDVALPLVRPGRYRAFGSPGGCTFCLVTNSALMKRFKIEEIGAYDRALVVPFDQGDSLEDLLGRTIIPEPAHVLVVSPSAFVRSPSPETVGKRKIMAMACNSTPTSMETVEYFLGVIENTDPDFQQRFADRFFLEAESSESLGFVENSLGTSAAFDYRTQHCEWHQQAGEIQWGGQQIAPGGELSILPTEILAFDPTLRLTIDGEIAFRGQPVLHSGTPSYLREDQARIHRELACLADYAVIATVENGVISRLRATNPGAQPAVAMLESIFAVDSRYRILWEVGFGINTALKSTLPGNHAMNEVFGGTGGIVHWGFGLTPYTQYALILPSLYTQVVGTRGAVLVQSNVSAPGGGMRRKVVGGCICHC